MPTDAHFTTEIVRSFPRRAEAAPQKRRCWRLVRKTALDLVLVLAMVHSSWVANAGPPDREAPTAPSGLTATPASSTRMNLSWVASTDNVGVLSYSIERCTGSSCSAFAVIAVASATETSYTNTALTASTTYSYRIRATDISNNQSGYSNIASATTLAPPDTQPPTQPSSVTATAVSSTRVDLAWNPSTDNVAVTGYVVERCETASCSNFMQIATPSSANYSDTALSAGTTYRYRVRAHDAVPNYSAYSTPVTTTTLDTQSPTTPTNLTAMVVARSQLNLTWVASTDNIGVAGYLVERCSGDGCSNFVQVAVVTGTVYFDMGLLAGGRYSYRVRARDAVPNYSDYSNVATAVASLTEVDCD